MANSILGSLSIAVPPVEIIKEYEEHAKAFLNSAGVAKTVMEFERNETLFSHGDPAEKIMYIQKGLADVSTTPRLRQNCGWS